MNQSVPKRIAGVTLVELMIALAIGTLLVLGLVQVFAASRAAYQMSEGMSRVQENARFAMDFVQRDLRMAGHFGCSTDQSHLLDTSASAGNRFELHFPAPVSYPVDFTVSVQGYEAASTEPGQTAEIGDFADGWAPLLPLAISELGVLEGSDVLVLRYLHGEGVPVETLTVSGGQTVVSVDPGRWDVLTAGGVNQPLLFGLSDCHQADIFAVAAAGVSAGAGTVTAAGGGIGARYGASGGVFTNYGETQLRLFRAESIVYYVGTGASGMPALFKARSNGGAYEPMELVEGIESMQLLYGLDVSSSGPRGYVTEHYTAEELGVDPDKWLTVGMIQVGFLAASPDPAAAPAAAGSLSYPNALGVNFDPGVINDGRYRTSYETTVALRNRLFGN